MKSGSFPSLQMLRRDPWAALRQAAERRSFKDKDLLYQAGEPANELYLLAEGRVRLFSYSAKGLSVTLSIVEPGDIFGELAMFPNQYQAGHARALSAGELYVLPRWQLERLLSDPRLVIEIIGNLGRRLQAVERRLGDLVFKSVPQRLATVLLDLADPAATGPGPACLAGHYTHAQLAEMVHAHRETVTKTLGRFQEERLVEFDRHQIVLLDVPRLQEMAMR
jgi:CRP/FNR family cyclic AMP-dependent transcriptional regulator